MSFCEFLLSASGRVTRAGAPATRAGAHVVLVTRVSGPAHHWRRRRKPAPNIFLPLWLVLVYDITARRTFNSVRSWMAQITDHADQQVNKVLVGNKSDNQSARQVSTQEGQALAAEYDVRFIEASAKADVNVTEAFQAIAQQVIDRIPRGMSRPASRQLSSKKSSKKSCSC